MDRAIFDMPSRVLPMRETAADVEVREKLWDASVAELKRCASSYAEASVKGAWSTDLQDEIVAAAKKRGYPAGLVRLGRRLVRGTKAAKRDLAQWRAKIAI